MEQKIKAGDIVQLKSGDMKMTVEYLILIKGKIHGAHCAWMCVGEKREGDFAVAALELV